ncbi:DNA internalization-related competence protein ComEC/Rec2 [Parahaliea maris]|uniref:DNA internalization-related competence protein ComEC/Rec2 n=1 Tax=Parahaliea maris TaxID=2716870 RepID=UPI0022A7EA4C|nr:DNA internalization-related competence protein ComEC/Rec2 [Parahaliea maris]
MAGLLISAGLPWLPAWPVVLLLGLAGTALVLRARRGARLAGLGLLGLLVGILHGHATVARTLPESCVRQPLVVAGRVVSLPRVTYFDARTRQQRFEFEVSSLSAPECRGPRRLLLSYYGEAAIEPGSRWRFEVLLRRPWGLVNPGSYNMQAGYARSGIDATGSVRSAPGSALPLPAVDAGLATLHHRARARISERIARLGLPRDVQAVLQAVTVAERSALDTGLWRLFQSFGLNHLLVISGLHIGLLAGLGYAIGRLLSLAGNRVALQLPGLLALLMALAYTALAGFSLATCRALLMLCVVVVAAALGRGAAAGHCLWLAAVVLLALNPLAALGSGFWLSFGAVACLLWRLQWHGRGRRFGQRVIAILGTHGYMALAMVPLAGGWFGGASLVSMPANLLVVPLLGLYVIPLSLAATFLALAGWSAADALWRAAAIPLGYLLPLADGIVQARPDWLYWRFSPSTAELVLAAVAIGLAVSPVAALRKWLAVALLLTPALLPPGVAKTASEDAVHLLFIDVGQGTSVLLYTRDRALLYDTGGGVPGGPTVADSVVLPLLRQRGIRRLDTLVLSHGDSDHSAGWVDIEEGVEVVAVRSGADLSRARHCRAGEAWHWPASPVTLRFLAPAEEQALSRNNGSCVLQLQIGATVVLLTGDIDSDRERQLLRYWGRGLRSDWLLAAHHGSNSSTGHAFLKQVAAQHVVISAGYANRFGHPHPDVLRRIAASGARAWFSAHEGAIELIFEPGESALEVVAHRRLQQFYWR